MHILIVGSNKQWAIENHYIKHLQDLNIRVSSYPAHDIFYNYFYGRITNKIKFRIGLSSVYQNINNELYALSVKNKYDVIWIFKGMEIFPDTLKRLKKNGIILINFNPDHPFLFSGKGSGNLNVLNSIKHYDLHLCYHRSVMDQIRREYHIPCEYFPFGYEPDNINLPSERDELKRVCFIGNPDKIRSTIIRKLILNDFPIDLFGNDWDKFIPKRNNVNILPAIYQKEFNKTAPRYRVQLNIFRNHNIGSHNMRTFEMPGLGCIMLTPFSHEQLEFYKEGEVFYYNNDDELYKKLRNILSMSYNESMSIRERARKRSVESGYDYKSRTKQLLHILNNFMANY